MFKVGDLWKCNRDFFKSDNFTNTYIYIYQIKIRLQLIDLDINKKIY